MPAKKHYFERNRLYLIGFRQQTDNFGNHRYQGKLMRGKHFALILPYSKRNGSYIVVPTTSAKLKHFDTQTGRLLVRNGVYDPKSKSIFLLDEMEITDMPKQTHFIMLRNGELNVHEIVIDDKVVDEITQKINHKMDKALDREQLHRQKQKQEQKLQKENALLKKQIRELKKANKELLGANKVAKPKPGLGVIR